MKPLIMSASGTRGIVGENLTPEIGLRVAKAFGTMLHKGPVIVGGDTRTSHDMLKSAVISGLLSVGTDVIDIGRVTTPTVQQLIRHYKAMGGMVITASHNPVIWNGIKLMNSSGSFLENDDYDHFAKLYDTATFTHATWENQGKLHVEPHALHIHINKILDIIDTTSIQNSGLRVLIDPNNGAGAVANPILFQKLNIHYDMLHSEPNGHFNHDPEPLKKNVSCIIEALQKGHYDIGFVQDADADRLVILDETGQFIGEDNSLGFCIDFILSQSPAPHHEVVVNLSTSLVIEDICNRHNAQIHYTKIGETHVTQGLKKWQATVGGEGNGGVIYPKVGWGRDSLVGMVIALKYLAESKKKVSEIVSQYPSYVMLREKINLPDTDSLAHLLKTVEAQFPEADINREDGVKLSLKGAWIHVRPSNTEPIVRIFIEAPTQEQADALWNRMSLS